MKEASFWLLKVQEHSLLISKENNAVALSMDWMHLAEQTLPEAAGTCPAVP